MANVKKYQLPPTRLIPNSPYPLLHYPGLLADNDNCNAVKVYDTFASNGWEMQWIFRYGQSQASHYHSQAHECMAVLTGSARIRFGVADTSSDLEASTHGSAKEDGGVEVDAHVGDVFVIPAGVSHKTLNTTPLGDFELLTPGDGHHIAAADARQALADIKLSGFAMMGAYPHGAVWDFATGGEEGIAFERVWAVAKPGNDPVLGKDEDGLCGQWKQPFS